jgi:monofunctional biosynthetic peptidoglycan transglycosylase
VRRFSLYAINGNSDGENKVGGKRSFSHDWEPIENISMNLQKAVIASEDGTFLKAQWF